MPAPVFQLVDAAKLHESDPPRGLRRTDLADDGRRTIALLGANGSGKSTLLGLLAGVHRPTAGEALVRGRPAGIDPEARRAVGVAFQTPALDPLLTVRENLNLFAALHAMPRSDNRPAAAIERFGLAVHADRRVGRLSGGLARRADLARAVLHEPALLLLDEPASALDPAASDALFKLLGELAHREGGPVVVFSTHELSQAERADRAVILRDGRVVVDGAPDELAASLGTRVLRTNQLPRDLDLSGAALSTDAAGGVLLAGDDPHALGAIADELNARGLGFALAPPTLRDVYERAMA